MNRLYRSRRALLGLGLIAVLACLPFVSAPARAQSLDPSLVDKIMPAVVQLGPLWSKT